MACGLPARQGRESSRQRSKQQDIVILGVEAFFLDSSCFQESLQMNPPRHCTKRANGRSAATLNDD
jgi:hypothetical protein